MSQALADTAIIDLAEVLRPAILRVSRRLRLEAHLGLHPLPAALDHLDRREIVARDLRAVDEPDEQFRRFQ